MKKNIFRNIAFLALASTAGFAADLPKSPEEIQSCGSSLPLTKKLVTLATAKGAYLRGANAGRNNPYIVSSFHGNEEDDGWLLGGTVVFVKQNGWKAFVMSEEETAQGIRVSGDDRQVTIFTMHTAEGPGTSFTILTTPDSFETFKCGALNFPKELNQPVYKDEYLQFSDFNNDEGGKGELIGQASIDDKDYWYSYATKDFGLHWAEPVRTELKPNLPTGNLREPAKVDLKALLTDLKKAAN